MHGLLTVSLRIANAYGPGQSPLRGQGLVAAVLHRLLTGAEIEVWGGGEAVRDYVSVDDVVEALIRAAAHPAPPAVVNIGSGVGRTVLEVTADAARALGLPPPSVIHKPGRAADVPVSVLDASLAADTLGWRATTGWEASLAQTARWIGAAGF